MTITSNALDANDHILAEYTCDGAGTSPPLTFSEIPDHTKSLTLIMEDPDTPNGVFTHWLLYDMSPATLQIPEGQSPITGKAGTNDFHTIGYGGPCPPSGTHRYIFTLYALDTVLGLQHGEHKATILAALDGHILDTAALASTYTRHNVTTK